MEIIKCKCVNKGIALGKVFYFHSRYEGIAKKITKDINSEMGRFRDALIAIRDQLSTLYEETLLKVGKDEAEIFEIQKTMLDDPDYIETIEGMIKEEGYTAEYAVYQAGNVFCKMFLSLEDDYMRNRSLDIQDLSSSLINILEGYELSFDKIPQNSIIASEDLTPSQIIQLYEYKVLGIVLSKGSLNSHMAILARTMGIPTIIHGGERISSKINGCWGIINGFDGLLFINPDKETEENQRYLMQKYHKAQEDLLKFKGMPDVSLDGVPIKLYANVGCLSDVEAAIKNDARGIGLFRSEFLYMERNSLPSEEDLFDVYKTAAELMDGKPVIIRTMDIGTDKKVDYLDLGEETNPALGYRAIRICLNRIDIFKTQLRAIYRAGLYGDISVMFPMIISKEEIVAIKDVIGVVKSELKREGIPYKEDIKIGIMIETPAAAVMSDVLAEEVDFFSIGTNDLTQYTLAIDREHTSLTEYPFANNDVIIRMIESIVRNAHKNNIWVGICGELGSEPSLIKKFLSIGVDELSVSVPDILPLRKIIRNTNSKND